NLTNASDGAGARPVNVSLDTSGAAPATPVVDASKPNGPATGPRVEPAAGDQPAPPVNNAGAAPATAPGVSTPAAASTAELLMLPEQQELKVGERRRVMIFLKTDAPLGLATATLRFDPRALAVRSVSQGILAADKPGAPVLTQSVDPSGVLLVSVAPAPGAQPLTGEGLLLVIEVEALAQGDASLQFDADKVHLIATDGRTVRTRVTASKFRITQ